MSKLLILSFFASASAFSLATSPRKPFRAAASSIGMDVAAQYDVQAFREYEECVVDAESVAELTACSDMSDASNVASSPDIFASMSEFMQRLMPKAPLDYDVDECIIQSENAAEATSCREK